MKKKINERKQHLEIQVGELTLLLQKQESLIYTCQMFDDLVLIGSLEFETSGRLKLFLQTFAKCTSTEANKFVRLISN